MLQKPQHLAKAQGPVEAALGRPSRCPAESSPAHTALGPPQHRGGTATLLGVSSTGGHMWLQGRLLQGKTERGITVKRTWSGLLLSVELTVHELWL